MTRRTVAARVVLLPPNRGGRAGSLLSGYRSLLRFEGTDLDFGFELELDPEVGPSGLAPGSSGAARISFWAVEDLPLLFAGQKFEIREGARVVGSGIIVEPQVSER
jgi:translation elongation factor EF-Tu-like GTPase